jgi:methyl-accepting chemotaxis protein
MLGLAAVGGTTYLGDKAMRDGDQKRAATAALSLASFDLISGAAELQALGGQVFQEPSTDVEGRFSKKLRVLEASAASSQASSASALAPIVADLKRIEEGLGGLKSLNETFGRTPKKGLQKDFNDAGKDMDRATRSLLIGAKGDGAFRLLEAVLVTRRIASDFQLTRNHKLIEAFADQKKAFLDALADANETDEHKSTLKLLIEGYDAAFQRWADVQVKRAEAFTTLEAAIADLQNAAGALNQSAAVSSDQASAEMAAQIADASLWSAIVILATFAACGLFGILTAQGISKPLGRLVGNLRDIATGRAEVAIKDLDREDEIGELARAVKAFQDAGSERVRLTQEAAEARQRVDAERTSAEMSNAERARHQAHVVQGLATGLERASGGDLVFRLSEPFSPQYEKIRSDFNLAMEKLQGAMKAIAVNTQEIHSGAGEIRASADKLAARTERQAASLEETAAALSEVTATVQRTAEDTGRATSIITTAKGMAERSGEVALSATTAMASIESSAKQIGQIIGVIDEIAFQTNLLALNAGVEAARAGSAGAGFAVVAAEVRGLAQRSAEAAKEIKALVSTSIGQVSQGVGLVGETRAAQAGIVAQIVEITKIVSAIARSAQEQAAGLRQVNAAVGDLDKATQQNAAMVEESTAASHRLAGEAEELARLVARFKVETEDRTMARSRGQAGRAA